MNLEVSILNQTNTNLKGVEEFLQELAHLMELEKDTEVSIVFCLNNFIHDLNFQFREKDQATDVLSFPSEMDIILGDIVISLEKAEAQAQNGLAAEIQMLLCHGFLHLLGYDHENSEEDFTIMMNLQALLLKKAQHSITVKA